MGIRALAELLGPGWGPVLAPVEDDIRAMGEFLRTEQGAGRGFLPAGQRIFAAFQQPFEQVRVLIVGQDPYPTPGHAVGLCFSVAPEVTPLPKSLDNIFREYRDDLGHPMPATGDLSPWVGQGVLLLNRVLTVQPGRPASHRGRGWEAVTDQVIAALCERAQPVVALLWGRDARSLATTLGPDRCLQAPHPSPLSASRGFFGSRPFSRANELLERHGAAPIDWRLPS